MLFLLVLLLVAGWNVSPLSAALAVTVIPLAALAGARVPGDPRTRAAAGCALVGGGVLALAWLPGASLWWTVIPQALAGVGMGLSLTALGGHLLPERTPRDAARLLAVRHAGIAAILAIAAPIAAHQLDVTTQTAKERGVALVLDAPLAPQAKIKLAPALLEGVDSDEPRAGLRRAVASERQTFTGRDRATYDSLGQRADDMLVAAVGEAFRSSFLLAGAAGLLAAALLIAGTQLAAMAAAGAVAIGTPVAYLALHRAIAPDAAGDPRPVHGQAHAAEDGRRDGLPAGPGAQAARQRRAARPGPRARSSCSRWPTRTRPSASEREHGVDPRSTAGLLQLLLK